MRFSTAGYVCSTQTRVISNPDVVFKTKFKAIISVESAQGALRLIGLIYINVLMDARK